MSAASPRSRTSIMMAATVSISPASSATLRVAICANLRVRRSPSSSRIISITNSILSQHIAPDDAAIRRAMLDIDGHVRRLDEDEAIAPALVRDREPTRVARLSADAHARTLQQGERFVLHPSLRNSDGQLRHSLNLSN